MLEKDRPGKVINQYRMNGASGKASERKRQSNREDTNEGYTRKDRKAQGKDRSHKVTS